VAMAPSVGLSSVTVHTVQMVERFRNIFAPSNSPGTQTRVLKF